LFNLSLESVSSGPYQSQYWGDLPKVLRSEGARTNWLHLYTPGAPLPDAKKAASAMRVFNESGKRIETHTTLDSFLSLGVLGQAIQDWIKLAWKGKRLEDAISTATQAETDFWPLFSQDWRESTYGVTAMSNVLFNSLLNAALKSLPTQRVGCYLQENQGWEFALIQNWRICTHGKLIGVPHSSVRFWYLSYFFDPRSYQRVSRSMPLPDKVAVNGQAATDAYIKGGYPLRDLVQVEALRYLYLANFDEGSKLSSTTRGEGLRLLILGDYLESNTRRQMRLLAQSAGSLQNDTVITVKPHPACPIYAKDYPELHLIITMEPLANLLTEADVVYTSAVTSAAVDAYCARVPVVSVLDPTMLNLSPLRGCKGVIYVSSSKTLISALRAVHLREVPVPPQASIFNLNIALPLWRQLLTRCA
jgi:surface carbohydrate biosynthesis protein (TIGR04326 family)